MSDGSAWRAAQRALWLIFFNLGVGYASWLGWIPAFRQSLSLSHEDLGWVLLSAGVGSVVVFPLTQRWMLARGSLWVTRYATLAGAVVLPLIAFGPAWGGTAGTLGLMLALALAGAAGSVLDVGMNAQAVLVEQQSGRSLMSRFHALFSFGGLLGAGGVMLAASADVPPWLHLTVVMGWSLLNLAWAWPRLLSVAAVRDTASASASAPYATAQPYRHPPLVWALGGLIICAFVIEGAMGDWGGVYLVDVYHASVAVAPVGFAMFSAAMVLGRWCGDGVIQRFGRPRTLIGASTMASVGVLVVLWSPWLWVGVAGFACIGAGMSVIVPILYGTVGHLPAEQGTRGLALVAMMGYAGALTGPPFLGFIAQAWHLKAAFTVLFALTAMLFFVPQWMGLLDEDDKK
ncbi:MAG: hypothetical protein RLZZ612_2348 [Pseudomonadota bacterium]